MGFSNFLAVKLGRTSNPSNFSAKEGSYRKKTEEPSKFAPQSTTTPTHPKMGSKRKRGAKEGANSLQNPQKRTKNESEPSTKKNKTKTTGATKTKADPTQVKALFVESPIGEDRKREAELYELLGSEDPEDRLKAGECVVHSLLGPDGGEGVSSAILRRHLDRRLFRGLASGRNASRVGFSLVLSDILGQLFGEKALAESTYQDLDFDTVLQILTEKIQIIGNIPGQEERDHYWGQYFGLCAFVKAGILFRDISRWNTVLDLLLKLAAKKVWLRSHCGWAIVEAIDQMNQKQAKATLERVAEANLAKTPEGVAIWLVALARFPDLKVKPWSDPLAKKSFGDLAAVLRESFQDFDKDQPERGQKNKQASWTAQSHFVWDILLAHYLKEGEAKAEEFQQFWARVVDGKFECVFSSISVANIDKTPYLPRAPPTDRSSRDSRFSRRC